MDLGTKTLLITGAGGWLGQAVLETLLEGDPSCDRIATPASGVHIRALVLPSDEAAVRARGNVETCVGDLRRPDDVRRFCSGAEGAVVLHLAGIIHPQRVSDFYEINLEGTRNVLASAAEARARRAVVMSSNSPLGCNPHPDHLFDEDSPYHPYMHYGRSKMHLEQHVAEVQTSGRLDTVVIRAPWFYGPHQPPRQTRFFEMVRDGRAPIVGSGENRRSMTYVGNLAQGLLLAAMTPQASGRTYWIADERPYTMNEIVDTVERLLENEFGQTCAHKRMRLPSLASEVAWVADKAMQALGLYKQEIHVLSEMNKTIACSIARARSELGYRPSVALEEGMRRSLAWLVERGLLPDPRASV